MAPITPPPGWFDDPTGRFGRRHWDGHRWSEHVLGANGDVVSDALPAGGPPLPPPRPAAAAPPAPSPNPAPHPRQVHGPAPFPPSVPGPGPGPGPGPSWGPGPQGPPGSFGPGLGLAVAGLGIVLVLLSLLAIPWSDADKSRFVQSVDEYAEIGTEYSLVAYTYVVWASWLSVLLAAGLVVLACVPVPRSGSATAFARPAGAVVAGLALLQHGWILHLGNVGEVRSSAGGWVGVVGWAAVGVGVALGPHRVGTPSSRADTDRVVGVLAGALVLVMAVGGGAFALTGADVEGYSPSATGGGGGLGGDTGGTGGLGGTGSGDSGDSDAEQGGSSATERQDSDSGSDSGSSGSSDSGGSGSAIDPDDWPTAVELRSTFPYPPGSRPGTAGDFPPLERDGYVTTVRHLDGGDVAKIKAFYDRELAALDMEWDPNPVTQGSRTVGWIGSIYLKGDEYQSATFEINTVQFTDGSEDVDLQLQSPE